MRRVVVPVNFVTRSLHALRPPYHSFISDPPGPQGSRKPEPIHLNCLSPPAGSSYNPCRERRLEKAGEQEGIPVPSSPFSAATPNSSPRDWNVQVPIQHTGTRTSFPALPRTMYILPYIPY